MKRGCELSRGFHPGRVRVKRMKGKEDHKGTNRSPRDRETQRKGIQRPAHLLVYSKDIHQGLHRASRVQSQRMYCEQRESPRPPRRIPMPRSDTAKTGHGGQRLPLEMKEPHGLGRTSCSLFSPPSWSCQQGIQGPGTFRL